MGFRCPECWRDSSEWELADLVLLALLKEAISSVTLVNYLREVVNLTLIDWSHVWLGQKKNLELELSEESSGLIAMMFGSEGI